MEPKCGQILHLTQRWHESYFVCEFKFLKFWLNIIYLSIHVSVICHVWVYIYIHTHTMKTKQSTFRGFQFVTSHIHAHVHECKSDWKYECKNDTLLHNFNHLNFIFLYLFYDLSSIHVFLFINRKLWFSVILFYLFPNPFQK